jgi:hypothetical protein
VLRVRVNNSLKIFFSETIIPTKLIFCRNVPWVGLFKICSQGFEIPNIFRTGKKSLKIFFSRTVGATGEQKTVLRSIKGLFSSLFEATSCDQYFKRLCFRECEGMKKSKFQC